MKNKYIFPAIFSEETGGFNISFPNLTGAFTCNEDFEDAMYMAKDCLEVYLHNLEEIPKRLNDEALNKKINFSAVFLEYFSQKQSTYL